MKESHFFIAGVGLGIVATLFAIAAPFVIAASLWMLRNRSVRQRFPYCLHAVVLGIFSGLLIDSVAFVVRGWLGVSYVDRSSDYVVFLIVWGYVTVFVAMLIALIVDFMPWMWRQMSRNEALSESKEFKGNKSD